MSAFDYCVISMGLLRPQKAKSRGNPSKFVFHAIRNICSKFGAFTRFVTIFDPMDRTIRALSIRPNILFWNSGYSMRRMEQYFPMRWTNQSQVIRFQVSRENTRSNGGLFYLYFLALGLLKGSEVEINDVLSEGDNGCFPFTKNPEIFHWEFPFGKSAFHLSHVPFVHRPLTFALPNDQMPLVNCLPSSRTRLSSSLSRQTNTYYRHMWLREDWHLYPSIFLGVQG